MDLVSSENPRPGLQMANLLFPHIAEREKLSLCVSFYKVTNPIHMGSTLMT